MARSGSRSSRKSRSSSRKSRSSSRKTSKKARESRRSPSKSPDENIGETGATRRSSKSPTREALTITELPEPNVSPRDPNHYRIIQLDNDLKAVLISTLGYVEREAKKVLQDRENKLRKCGGTTRAKSVFERTRSSSCDKQKNRAEAAKEKSPRCFEKTVERFDRDMSEASVKASRKDPRGSVLSQIYDIISVEQEPIPMDIDEPSNVLLPKQGHIDEDEHEDEENVEKPEEENTGNQKVPIKTKWGPEPETNNKDLLEEERKIMRNKSRKVDIALSFYGGSMHDGLKQGISYLAREAVSRAIKGKGIHISGEGFNPAEYTTISLETDSDNLQQSLQHISTNLTNMHTTKKHILESVDILDLMEEYAQCRCWVTPMVDRRRLTILASLAKEKHPVRGISTGDPPSLWRAGEESHKNELVDNVEQYIQEHYNKGCKTTIAIMAPEKLDNIQEAVASAFGSLEKGSRMESEGDDDPFNTSEFTMFYKVLCSNPHCSDLGDAFFVISWGLPAEYWKNYLTKPLDYLGALISDKGEGGLGHYLREKNLVWDLNAACQQGNIGLHRNKFTSLFEIQTTLNEDGWNNVDEVIKAIFSYLKFLKTNGPSKEFFYEQQKIRSAQFHALGQEINWDEPYPLTVSKLSLGLQLHESRDLLTAPSILRKYDEYVLSKAIDLLVPETANYMLLVCSNDPSSAHPNLKVEPIFNTKYIAEDISQDRRNAWADVSVYSEFRFPDPNPFIHVNSCRVEEEKTHFNLLDAGESLLGEFYRIWYHQDIRQDHFARYYIHIISPISNESPENAAMLQLWYLLLNDLLLPHLGAATAAGINYNIKPTQYGLLIAVFSWNSHLPVVVEMILREIAEFGENVKRESFQKKKKGWLKHLESLIRDEYLSHHILSTDLYEAVVHVNRWKLTDLYNELSQIKMKDFAEFINDFKRSFSVVALLHGNVNKGSAVEFAATLERTLPPNEYFNDFHIQQNILPRQGRALRFKTLSEFSSENYVNNCYQIGWSQLLTRICADLFFICLRGYLKEFQQSRRKASRTKGKKSPSNGKSLEEEDESEEDDEQEWFLIPRLLDQQGIVTLMVESFGNYSDNDIKKLDVRADQLLEDCYNKTVKKMNEKDFKALKKTLTEEYNDPNSGYLVGNESHVYDLSALYGAIQDLTFRFTDNACKLERLRSVTLENLQCFYNQHLVKNACEFRKLSIQIAGNPAGDDEKPQVSPETREEWRERRKTIRECTFHEHYSLVHAHKMDPCEQLFDIHFETSEDGKCDNSYFISNFGLFKRGLYHFPQQLRKEK